MINPDLEEAAQLSRGRSAEIVFISGTYVGRYVLVIVRILSPTSFRATGYGFHPGPYLQGGPSLFGRDLPA